MFEILAIQMAIYYNISTWLLSLEIDTSTPVQIRDEIVVVLFYDGSTLFGSFNAELNYKQFSLI